MKEKVLDLHDLTAFPAFGKSGGGERGEVGGKAGGGGQRGAPVRKGEGGGGGA